MGRPAANHTNKRYGNLLVLSRIENSPKGNTRWDAICDCGRKVTVYGSHLEAGHKKSCGAKQHYRNSLEPGEAGFKRLIRGMKRDARRRGYEWSLSTEEIGWLTKLNCYYCGTVPSQICISDIPIGNYIYNGLDRVDNDLGYKLGNVVPCCGKCNRAKSNLSQQEFFEMARLITENYEKTAVVVPASFI